MFTVFLIWTYKQAFLPSYAFSGQRLQYLTLIGLEWSLRTQSALSNANGRHLVRRRIPNKTNLCRQCVAVPLRRQLSVQTSRTNERFSQVWLASPFAVVFYNRDVPKLIYSSLRWINPSVSEYPVWNHPCNAISVIFAILHDTAE